MRIYYPEEWLLVKITGDQQHYRLFGSWYGDCINGDSWRMNSGITSVKKEGDYFMFHGKSGSINKCHKDNYGISSLYTNTILADYKNRLKDKFKIFKKMPKNITKINWLIK